jgi:hypothetical protein
MVGRLGGGLTALLSSTACASVAASIDAPATIAILATLAIRSIPCFRTRLNEPRLTETERTRNVSVFADMLNRLL